MRPAAIVAVLLQASLFGQQRVPAEFMYHRVYAVVPLVGTGKMDDTRRPMFAPTPPRPTAQLATPAQPPERTGIIGYQMQVSDDGKSALVEFVFATPQSMRAFIDAHPSVKTFVKGRSRKEDIETEFRKVKRNFSLENFRGLGVQ
jgi:hypothetical protein